MERHRLDVFALMGGLVTLVIGVIGLLHQCDAFDLGPGQVALIGTAALVATGIALVLLLPKKTDDLDDPRLKRRR